MTLIFRLAIILIALTSACATEDEMALRAAKRDFPGCRDFKVEKERFYDEVVVIVCGSPATYVVTPVQTFRKR